MRVTVVDAGQKLRIGGRLDATTVADVRQALHRAADEGQGDLVVDLSQVEVLDATGLGVLVGTHRRARLLGRRLVLREVPDRIERLLLVTRLHRVLTVDHRAEALSL